ncbi:MULTISPECIES: DUF2063 domain-containing protein [Halocynthiibacter]|uniref:DNA-binding domain-containing protein n=1 Tax=Halocynthiibacter halioticoli TaxID=2986804 RepID=A0AAE3LUD9_9RHOB|nr:MULTISPECIES: DNA-binding domain-containing protein [Halocynthiibacter]MCV6823815.1 putative DNA-binding domain-containing protein [Halocynthiibacter halioticoli]MCW4056816.1 putative DNA-binding domain-containing protein [Halocynthiibacter sp. SDUM655004]
MTEAVTQSEFIAALLDPDRATPSGLVDPQNNVADKRFAVYRNNVAVSLTEALIVAYPVIHKLLGDEFFKALAGVHLRQFPPRSPLMMHYGEDMPAFLEGFEPVAAYPYLADVARLELAIRKSYHAADTTPISPEDLQNLPPDVLMQSRLTLAPSLKVMTSNWPIHAIYVANTTDTQPTNLSGAQNVLIIRPEFDPEVHRITDAEAAFLTALSEDKTFATALEAAANLDAGFDLSRTLGLLLAGAAITKISSPKET